jgi:transcriptional regulator with XRE-family HTH domain
MDDETKTNGHFGKALAAARKAAGFTQTKAAKMAGISQAAWSNLEQSMYYPRQQMVIKLERVVCQSLVQLQSVEPQVGRPGQKALPFEPLEE